MRKYLLPILLTMTGVQAQTLPAAPSSILTPPAAHAAPGAAAAVQGKLALPRTRAPRIAVRAVAISGVHALPQAEIARLFAPVIGRTVSTADLNQILDAVNRRYADAGFALCRAYIQAQKMQNGILHVQVLEGYVETVVVHTDSARVRRTIASYAAGITASRPLRTRTLDRQLRLITEIPGIKVQARLTEMSLRSGAASLVLTVRYHAFTTALAVAPSAVRGLPFLPYVTISANNLLGDADQITFIGLLSPIPKDEYFFQLGASAAIGHNGWRIATTDFMAKARANGLPPGLDLTSTQLHNELQLNYPLVKSISDQMNIAGGSYFSRTGYDLNHVRLARDRYLATYLQWSDSRQMSPHYSQSVSLRLTGGFALADAPPRSRANAANDFARLGADASFSYAPVAAFGILLRADGQIASGSLMAAEEDVYGGDRFGRGYDSGVLSGDQGLGLTLQPQYNFTLAPDWRASAYVFGDYAHVANSHGDRQGNATLASSGIGLQLVHGVYIAGLGIAEPLKSFRGYAYRLTPRLFGTLQARL